MLQDSAHLCNWPNTNKSLIDKELNEKMDLVRQIVALGLKLRAKSGLKVRQPLQKLEVRSKKLEKDKELLSLIKDELNIKEVRFVEKITEGLKEEKEGLIKIGLDTKITPQLKEEGTVREVIRQIQDMRKDAKYKPRWLAMVNYSTTSELDKIFLEHREYIKKETNLKDFVGEKESKKAFDVEKEITLDSQKLWLGIKKT